MILYMKDEYVQKIVDLLHTTEDVVTLDLILQLLQKTQKA